MKAKQFVLPLVIFILGIILTIIGALFKIQHWPYAPQILTLGTIVEVIGLLLLIVVLIKYFFKK
ncbi:hypothetical protein CW733_07660 [Lacinutrix sp. Bg11-31]|nr:hypothetical protein CW733_07660 [Lacinutrix sp. Bg11-31]